MTAGKLLTPFFGGLVFGAMLAIVGAVMLAQGAETFEHFLAELDEEHGIRPDLYLCRD